MIVRFDKEAWPTHVPTLRTAPFTSLLWSRGPSTVVLGIASGKAYPSDGGYSLNLKDSYKATEGPDWNRSC